MKFKIVIKKTAINILLLYIAFAIISGIVLYSIASYLMIVGLESRSAIPLGTGISMVLMMIALKLTGIKMERVEESEEKTNSDEFKPRVFPREACHSLVLSKGQKENKREKGS